MSVVLFDYDRWKVRYPELARSVTQNLAQMYFDEATLYCDNTGCSPVSNLVVRAQFLFMVTAHIARLNAAQDGEEASQLVGRISSATEGSVSVQATYESAPGSEQWFSLTRYGAAFWAASAQFRQMQYAVGQNYNPDPYSAVY